MFRVTVELTGRTMLDIEAALAEVGRSLGEGNISDGQETEAGEWSFELDGEPEGAVYVYGSYIHFDDQSSQWMAVCPEHGVLRYADGNEEGHDDLVQLAVAHEQDEHDGNGIVPVNMLLLGGHGSRV